MKRTPQIFAALCLLALPLVCSSRSYAQANVGDMLNLNQTVTGVKTWTANNIHQGNETFSGNSTFSGQNNYTTYNTYTAVGPVDLIILQCPNGSFNCESPGFGFVAYNAAGQQMQAAAYLDNNGVLQLNTFGACNGGRNGVCLQTDVFNLYVQNSLSGPGLNTSATAANFTVPFSPQVVSTDPVGGVALGSTWLNTNNLSNNGPHYTYSGGDSSIAILTNTDGPWDFANGVSGPMSLPGGALNPTLLAYAGTATQMFCVTCTFQNPVFLNLTNDLWRMYNGTSNPTITQTPAVGQLAAGKNPSTDGLMLSYGSYRSGVFSQVLRQGDDIPQPLSLVLPISGAPSQTAAGSEVYDSTYDRLTYGSGSVTRRVPKTICMPLNSNSDTLTNSTASEQFFASTCKIPASEMLANMAFRFYMGMQVTGPATTTPFTLSLALCTVSGCGSGTKTYLYQSASTNSTGTVTNQGVGMTFIFQANGAPGSSVQVETEPMGSTWTAGTTALSSRVAQPVTIATNVDEYLTITIAYGSTTNSGQSTTVRQIIAEVLN
jgi:hypothetical protein